MRVTITGAPAIFASVQKRPSRGSYTGYGKRMPSDRPPVLTPKELALTAATDGKELPLGGNGQAPNLAKGGYPGSIPGAIGGPYGIDPMPGQYGSGLESGDDGPRGT